MVAAPDLGSGAVRRVGSSPIRRTENGFNRFLQAEFIKSIFFVHWGIDSARLNQIRSGAVRRVGSSPIRRTENGFNRFLQAEFIKSIFFVHWGIDSARLNQIQRFTGS